MDLFTQLSEDNLHFTLDKSVSYSALALLLSSAIPSSTITLSISIKSDLLKRLLVFAQVAGIHPASQFKDFLAIFISHSAKFGESVINCKLLLIQRPMYYDGIVLDVKNPIQTLLMQRTSINVSPEWSLTWKFIEGQSLNSIYALPRIFLQRGTVFRFSIHAPSSLLRSNSLDVGLCFPGVPYIKATFHNWLPLDKHQTLMSFLYFFLLILDPSCYPIYPSSRAMDPKPIAP